MIYKYIYIYYITIILIIMMDELSIIQERPYCNWYGTITD